MFVQSRPKRPLNSDRRRDLFKSLLSIFPAFCLLWVILGAGAVRAAVPACRAPEGGEDRPTGLPSSRAKNPSAETPEADEASPKPTTDGPVLVMNPSLKTLKDFVFLVENRVLRIPKLRMIAVYHQDSKAPYREARTYLHKYPRRWLSLRRAQCRISEKDVFKDNPCREELARWVANSRAMIFTGGTDLLPSLYGQPTRLTTRVKTPRRHIFEVSALHHLVGTPEGQPPLLEQHPSYKILAICLGMQTLNVALGGTLHQDIPTDVYGLQTAQDVLALPRAQQHACYANQAYSTAPNKLWTVHPVRFESEWSFGEVPDTGVVDAISFHHQGVDRLGKNLRVLATSIDEEVVEAVRHTRYPHVFGVQFHPEYAQAWTAQRPCGSRGKRSAEAGDYVLRSEMASFYQDFWRSFSESLASDAESGEVAQREVPQSPDPVSNEVRDEAGSKAVIQAQRAARRTMSRGLSLFQKDRVGRCSFLGRLSSPITSKVGLRPSKAATCDPEFAAVLVELFDRAGLEPGDAIGVALSGSFPALNLATIAASEAMDLKPVVVSSLSSSMFGANRPDETWVDMESRLIGAGVIETRSRAVTLGGRDDNGAGLPKEGVRLLRAAVERNPVPLLRTGSLNAAIQARLRLYREGAGPDGLKAFVNVGGGKASVGTLDNKKRFRPGLNLEAPRDLERSGVMATVSQDGLPVIYLGNIRRLCREHDLQCFPSLEKGRAS